MGLAENITDGRYPISSLSHSKCKSFIKSLHPKNHETGLILFSDGWIVIEEGNDLLKPGSRRILNVKEVKSIEYSGGKYHHRLMYKLLNIASLLSAFLMFLYSEDIFEAAFTGSDIGEGSVVIYSALIWVFFDLYRDTMAEAAHLKFNLTDGENKQLFGLLPNDGLHVTSIIFVLLSVFVFAIFFFEWAIEKAPVLGDVFGYVMLIFIITLLLKFLYGLFSEDKPLSGINSADIPNGMVHMYFAIMALRTNINSSSINEENGIPISELKAIKERLLEHDLILSAIAPSKDILSVPSPSLGAIAIRVSTEAIMRSVCDIIGINSKPNAKATLVTYVNQYKTKVELDSKIDSYLENIRIMGNRAAHDFNVDWDEFKVILNQFCEIVSWYSTIVPKEFDIVKSN